MEVQIYEILKERILVLDGAMGTMIQRYGLNEEDFRGERFSEHAQPLAGNNDVLSLSRPDIIEEIHKSYLSAGADIIETNTFSSNFISQADYGLEGACYEMNVAAARIARRVADEFNASQAGKPRFVAGSLGPTNQTASLSPDVNDPGFRAVTFDELRRAYKEQAEGLLEGGVDMFLVETVFDTLNAKAAIYGIEEIFEEKGQRLPLILSGTITDASGRTLSGQTVEAFLISVSHADALAIGFNCAMGAQQLFTHIRELSDKTETAVIAYPNAGLPNEFGQYDETPESHAAQLKQYLDHGLVNIIGGCCGTTPAHITSIAEMVADYGPRVAKTQKPCAAFSGLEPLLLFEGANFINIGERTNVAGSRKFARLIAEDKYEEALSVALQQVENGAQMIDVNMDEAMLDSPAAMRRFLHLIASEPAIARIPVMIDSSDWEVIEEGLQCLQGKGVVNSISLKEGEEIFLQRAKKIRRYGAAAVVMAFDEQGQAVSYERKIEICERAYELLTEKAGYRPQDIIMDVNVLTVGTGISEHSNYAVDFIRAVEWIGQNLPGVLTSGGISNVSFAFRGNGPIREAMHTVFLYHAIKAGLDMGIVNAGMIGIYEDLPAGLLEAVEDVLFNRRPDATDRLLGFAAEVSADDKKGKTAEEWRKKSVEERLSHALINGNTEYIDADALEALEKLGKPLSVIEGPLMNGMNRVGELFAAGKMFLPQVVKSARVMKKAVAVLQPYLEAGREKGQGSAAGKVLMATVKGDVHDIGKNIVSVVLGCNNYEIIDLGVMVPCEKIAEAVRREKPDIIGLSGLITPSLHEMEFNASEFEREGFSIPLMIGGATTSRVHTAVKINPLYKGPVVHVPDASQAVTVAGQLLNPKLNEGYKNDIEEEYAALRKNYLERSRKKEYLSIEQARANRFVPSYDEKLIKAPAHVGLSVFDDVPLEELFSLIDWTPFFRAWEMKGKYPAILQDGQTGVEATRLFSDAQKMLNSIGSEKWLRAKAVAGIWPANSCGDDILLYSNEDRDEVLATVHCLRQQGKKAPSAPNLSLADFIAPAGSSVADYLGAFAVTAGLGIEKKLSEFEEAGDDYNSILLKALSDRLAEALAEWLHMKVRKELWAYQADESLDNDALIREEYRGIRPAPGYPACPDHREKITLWTLLDAKRNTRIRLTENLAMHPLSSVCGYYFAHPESRYFGLGKIGEDQAKDYARRRGCSLADVEKWLAPHLNYK